MKKILIIIALSVGSNAAGDVYCVSAGTDTLYCYDDDREWFVFEGV